MTTKATAARKTATKSVATRVRRPQEERSEATRARVIEAAIKCLHRVGYAGTSTTLVVEEAGVSRGAMLHHFPSKAELMLAVVRSVFHEDGELYERSLMATTPRQWLREFPATMWEVISRPAGVAVIEIMLGARSDPEFAKRLRAEQQQIDREAHVWVVKHMAAADIDDRPDGEAVHRLFVAAVRGLALEQLFMRNKAEVMRSIEVLTNVLRQLYPDIDT